MDTSLAFLLNPVVWMSLGIALIALEILIPGYFLLGFGVSAGAIAVLTRFGPAWLLLPEALDTTSVTNTALILTCAWLALGLLAWYALARMLKDTRPDINSFDPRPRV